ncbi:hypothetical protein FRC10_004570 [Ceratobasidium sp. 414]|nr:hypothetical protein FRC10_004570 [Ceratobasidium sp. 414]
MGSQMRDRLIWVNSWTSIQEVTATHTAMSRNGTNSLPGLNIHDPYNSIIATKDDQRMQSVEIQCPSYGQDVILVTVSAHSQVTKVSTNIRNLQTPYDGEHVIPRLYQSQLRMEPR